MWFFSIGMQESIQNGKIVPNPGKKNALKAGETPHLQSFIYMSYSTLTMIMAANLLSRTYLASPTAMIRLGSPGSLRNMVIFMP